MSARLLYRLAATLFLLFAAGHTVGFLSMRPPSAEGMAVYDAMNRVHFQVDGGSHTYGGFYTGFGLDVTVYLLFSAFLAWHLGSVAAEAPRAIGTLGWVFFVVHIVILALSWIYFFPAPVVFSALIAACLGAAAARVRAVTM